MINVILWATPLDIFSFFSAAFHFFRTVSTTSKCFESKAIQFAAYLHYPTFLRIGVVNRKSENFPLVILFLLISFQIDNMLPFPIYLTGDDDLLSTLFQLNSSFLIWWQQLLHIAHGIFLVT